MWECEGESGCARVCESVGEREDPRSLFITIITSHHHYPLFNQYIDIQVYIYIARQFFSVRNKCITNTVRARLSLSQTTKAARLPTLAVHTWFRALAQAAKEGPPPAASKGKQAGKSPGSASMTRSALLFVSVDSNLYHIQHDHSKSKMHTPLARGT